MPFTPFLPLADPALVADATRTARRRPAGRRAAPCAGGRASAAGRRRWPRAISCRQRSGLAPDLPAAPYRFLPDPVHQFLLASGRPRSAACASATCAGWRWTSRSPTGARLRVPQRARARPTASSPIALADSTGFRHVLSGATVSRARAARGVLRGSSASAIPTCIEGHNIFRFDLEYLEARARRHRVALAWGRDGSDAARPPGPRCRWPSAASATAATRSPAATSWTPGCWPSSTTWARATCRPSGSRTSRATSGWRRRIAPTSTPRGDPAHLRGGARAAHGLRARRRAGDARRCRAILSPPYFVAGPGPAVRLPDDGAARQRHQDRRAAHARVPAPAPRGARARRGPRSAGGYTAVFQQGVARDVLHVDVTSLYPSLMLGQELAPASDALGVFPALLARPARVPRLGQAAGPRGGRPRGPALPARAPADVQDLHQLLLRLPRLLAAALERLRRRQPRDRRGPAARHGLARPAQARWAPPRSRSTPTASTSCRRPATLAERRRPLLEAIAAGLPEGIQLELDGRYAAMSATR